MDLVWRTVHLDIKTCLMETDYKLVKPKFHLNTMSESENCVDLKSVAFVKASI